jgi:DNA-binding XRE family transcriptional regulator
MVLTVLRVTPILLASSSWLQSIENAVYIPSTYLALKMARAFGLAVEELFQIPE